MGGLGAGFVIRRFGRIIHCHALYFMYHSISLRLHTDTYDADPPRCQYRLIICTEPSIPTHPQCHYLLNLVSADIISRLFDLHSSILLDCPYVYPPHQDSGPNMAPKRPAKRRGDQEDARPAKKGGKGKKEPTYDTYDECLDGTSAHNFGRSQLSQQAVWRWRKRERGTVMVTRWVECHRPSDEANE
jgi:hypothetical protein